MKKIILTLLIFFALLSCSGDSTSSSVENSDGQGGSLAIFALKNNYLYSVDVATLNVFSLLNEQQPVKVNSIQIGFDIETIFSMDDYLFIGSRSGMFIYSIADPEKPTKLSQVQHFTACDPVIANATHSFVTLNSNRFCGNNTNVLQIYNTTNLSNPLLVHSRNLVAPKGLALYNNYLFVCDDVIKIFNITNPVEPILAANIDRECFDLIIRGNQLFAVGNSGLYRYELNPSDITDIIFKSLVAF
jgi:hypothetical protein